MDQVNHEYYVSWIIADYTPVEYDGHNYFVSTPSRDNRFLAELTYKNIYGEAVLAGAIVEQDIMKLLSKYNLWDKSKDDLTAKLQKDAEQLKVDMYKNFSSKNSLAVLRKSLRDTEDYLNRLYTEKHQWDFLGPAFIASTAKHHYLTGTSLFKRRNLPLYKGNWFSTRDDSIINATYKVMSAHMLTESNYRELARSSTWRNVWSLKKSGGNIFGRPSADFSAPQRQLTMYSNMYDNIYRNSECPSEGIIADDDALDGWMIEQRRRREKEAGKAGILSNIPEKVAACEEQFILCNKEYLDIEPPSQNEVYQCNDVAGKMALKIRQSQLEKERVIPEQRQRDRLQQLTVGV